MPIKKRGGRKGVGQSHRATPRDLRSPSLPPASDVVVRSVDGEVLRVEPALTRLPSAKENPRDVKRRKPPKPPDGPNRFTRTRNAEAGSAKPTQSKKKPGSGRKARPTPKPKVTLDPALTYTLHTDGACSPNPGRAAAGAVLRNPQGEVVEKVSMEVGHGTSNTAEYKGLIEGLKLAHKNGARHLAVFMDSSFVRDSVVTRRGSKKEHLKPLHAESLELLDRFAAVEVTRIPREQNSEADALAGAPLGIAPGANVVVGRMVARWSSPCRWCGHGVEVGATICRMQDGGIWVCEACAIQMSRPTEMTG